MHHPMLQWFSDYLPLDTPFILSPSVHEAIKDKDYFQQTVQKGPPIKILSSDQEE
jgi:hypothetical protein